MKEKLDLRKEREKEIFLLEQAISYLQEELKAKDAFLERQHSRIEELVEQNKKLVDMITMILQEGEYEYNSKVIFMQKKKMKNSKKWAVGLALAMVVSTIAPTTYTLAANGLLIAPALSSSSSKNYSITLGTKENPSLTELELKRKETIALNVYGIAEEQKEDVTYHWTVEGSAVTVDDTGVVTAVKTGISIVKLTMEDTLTGTFDEVMPITIVVKGIVINKNQKPAVTSKPAVTAKPITPVITKTPKPIIKPTIPVVTKVPIITTKPIKPAVTTKPVATVTVTPAPTVIVTPAPTATPTPTKEAEIGLSEKQVYESMIALKSEYPEGMPWTNDNYYGWNGGIYSGGYGCAGFAFLLSDAAFGSLKAYQHEDFSAIRVGDILRINNDTHSVIILEIREDSIVIAEGNYNYSIHWGRIISKEKLEQIGDYVLTRYSN